MARDREITSTEFQRKYGELIEEVRMSNVTLVVTSQNRKHFVIMPYALYARLTHKNQLSFDMNDPQESDGTE